MGETAVAVFFVASLVALVGTLAVSCWHSEAELAVATAELAAWTR